MISDEQLAEWERLARAEATNIGPATAVRLVHTARTAVPALVEEVRELRRKLRKSDMLLDPERTTNWDRSLGERIAAAREVLRITSGRVRLPGEADEDEETKA